MAVLFGAAYGQQDHLLGLCGLIDLGPSEMFVADFV